MRAVVFFVNFDDEVGGESRVIRHTSVFVGHVSKVLVIDAGDVGEVKRCQSHSNGCIMCTVKYQFRTSACNCCLKVVNHVFKEGSSCGLILDRLIK